MCEATLSLMQGKTHPHMSVIGLRLLSGLFQSRPPPRTLGWKLNAQLANALYDQRPSVNDPAPTREWLAAMREALVNLAHRTEEEPRVCLLNAVTFFGEAKRGWASDRAEVARETTQAMKKVLGECIAPR